MVNTEQERQTLITDQQKAERPGRESIKSLRFKAAEDTGYTGMAVAITNFAHGIVSALALSFTKPEKNAMCKYYGHVKAEGSWQGELPKCTDCGETISSLAELRKAHHEEIWSSSY